MPKKQTPAVPFLYLQEGATVHHYSLRGTLYRPGSTLPSRSGYIHVQSALDEARSGWAPAANEQLWSTWLTTALTQPLPRPSFAKAREAVPHEKAAIKTIAPPREPIRIRIPIPAWIAEFQLDLKKVAAASLQHVATVATAGALALTLLTVGPIAVLESQSLLIKAENHYRTFIGKPLPTPATVLPSEFDVAIASPQDVFSVKIPELKIESIVVPNVDASDPKVYEKALKDGVAHMMGTGLPGQDGHTKTVFLFAHSTNAPWNIRRFNAQFYALKDAKPGMTVTARFWGQDYTYVVKETVLVEPDDTTWLTPQTDTDRLILQTCFPPGTAEQRLLVIAERQS